MWIGETVFPTDRSVYQTIEAALFANIKTGNLLRVKYKDVKVGAQLNPQYSDGTSWLQLPLLDE